MSVADVPASAARRTQLNRKAGRAHGFGRGGGGCMRRYSPSAGSSIHEIPAHSYGIEFSRQPVVAEQACGSLRGVSPWHHCTPKTSGIVSGCGKASHRVCVYMNQYGPVSGTPSLTTQRSGFSLAKTPAGESPAVASIRAESTLKSFKNAGWSCSVR